jgi:serine/threonine-protein kinase HipA
VRRQPPKANRAEPRTLEVWGDGYDLGATTLVGEVTASAIRGSEVTSFEYSDRWLTGPRVKIDPHLPLFEGRQYPKPPLTQFGAFADASPDRWGRTLLDRREALRAREEGRPRRTLMPHDYLLGVHDGHRMGALRFKHKGGPFLDDDDEKASPPWTSLGELAFASQQLERIGVEDEPRYGRWLAMLLAPGRSLGGARPKASVRDRDDVLWIAKFPSASDDRDVGAWEMVAHELANMAGITVPEAALHQFASHHHTFLSRRFDRNGTHRLHFSSAMTQLGQTDSHVDPGVGYLDIAAFLAREGAAPESDLPELWRRVVFGVCICNTDDHLRNHGFLWTRDGWRLAPAFDLNPNPSGTALAIPYDGVNVDLDLEPVREAASVFRLADARADQILATVVAATKQWREVAARLGVRREEREGMARAFQAADQA